MKKVHFLRSLLLECAKELGRVPTASEFMSVKEISKHHITEIGGYEILLKGCGLMAEPDKKAKFKYIKPKIDSLVFSHTETINLNDLFLRFGNPEFISAAAMPDVHVEHADPYALNCFLEFLAWRKPKLLVILGDFLNAGGLSHWGQDSIDPMRFVPEAIRGRELMGIIRGILPDAMIVFLGGNHEDWIRQFLLANQNPQLFHGLEALGLEITLEKILDFKKYKVVFFPFNKIVRIGKASFTHGLYTGDNHAKKHLSGVKSSIFYGHTHDSKSFVETSINGPVIAQSLMCLCDLNPTFLRGLLNNWEHGFGEFSFFKDGSFTHTAPKILSGKTIVDGKILRA